MAIRTGFVDPDINEMRAVWWTHHIYNGDLVDRTVHRSQEAAWDALVDWIENDRIAGHPVKRDDLV